MIKKYNECVGCDIPSCLGESCPLRNVRRYFCDVCGDEFDADDLYEFDGDMFCQECLIEKLLDEEIIERVKGEKYGRE